MRERALGAHGSVPEGGEYAFDGIGRAQVVPVLGREIEEGRECLGVFGQARHGALIFGAILLPEDVDGGAGGLPGLGMIDVAQVGLHGWRHGL